ncbi:hypothetical protein VPNG_05391 [Cytospora leucostoma]|uniref:Nascent polypeptide-associated complex subunit alpha-like UBA domain-containing protein n=1 Tax=Cytospora leucostoma TaxID=1230097 RepID=A0A423X4G9_9PEZI|nr:hypothetical protein VPNG_05391 [Cytospora leucostoma]
MAEEKQPAGIVEGATAGDVEEEVQDQQAKSAEDRKAAAALSKLDTREDEGSASADQQASLSEAMNKLGGAPSKAEEKKDLRKVKVDAADVTLLVDELDLTKPKATELLKQHDGDAVKAMKAFIAVNGS